jgi:alanine racemase
VNQDYPVWAEINLAAVAHNIKALKALTKPGTKFMAVVKANGYGHGAEEVARVALENGADWLAVARVEEGIELRKKGIKASILVFGLVTGNMIREALENNLVLTVYNPESARAVADAALARGRNAPVHLKVDTGMGRLGFFLDEQSIKEIRDVISIPGLDPLGIYTHFAAADAGDKSYTRLQLQRFQEGLQVLAGYGIDFPLRHAANSAALIDLPGAHFDMVRPGISIYGLYPSGDVDQSRVALKPAMALKTRVTQVKEVDAGFSVSYGCTYVTPAPTTLATVAVGYADGYTRLLSSKASVLVHGERAPVVGRICMDQCVIDVGHIPGVKPGDEVVLMGSQGNNTISAYEIASAIGTINYEVVTMISARVPRVYL